MSSTINVVQFGMGPIGLKTTGHLLEKENLRIVGAVDVDPAKLGKGLHELTDAPESLGVQISSDAQKVLAETGADVAVVTTTSSLESVRPLITQIVSAGVNVVSTCEELSFPWKTSPKIAAQIDDAARNNGVSVLGTGVNPGFLMDFLPLAMTGLCRNVKKVNMSRIQNAQFRRIPFQKKIGAGLTPDQFRAKVDEGTLRHVGLTESMHMIASRLGWELTRTEDVVDPVIATSPLKTKDIQIETGQALGVHQVGRGFVGDEEVITLVFHAVVGEPDPRDHVHIEGTPPIDLTIRGGVNGDIATCAITVNAIPVVVRAQPGLRTMADIQPVSCI